MILHNQSSLSLRLNSNIDSMLCIPTTTSDNNKLNSLLTFKHLNTQSVLKLLGKPQTRAQWTLHVTMPSPKTY